MQSQPSRLSCSACSNRDADFPFLIREQVSVVRWSNAEVACLDRKRIG